MKPRLQTSAIRLLALVCLLAGGAWAQTNTLVTGTITDPSGIPYSNARVAIALVVPSGPSPTLTPCTNPQGNCPVNNPSSATTDGLGHFFVNLWANASIVPAGSTYTFTVTEPGAPAPLGTGPQTFVLSGVTIAGTAQDLTTALEAVPPPALSNITGGGGGGSAAGNPFDVQVKCATGTLFCSGVTDPANAGNLSTFGPNPVLSANLYGARALSSAQWLTTTASCTSGSNQLTLASVAGLQVGDGIVAAGCGAASTLSAPAAPTVTPSQPTGPMGTYIDTPSPAGTGANQYVCAPVDFNGSEGPSSSATSIATAQPLGPTTSAAVTSWTKSGNVLTINVANTMSVGTYFRFASSSDKSVNGIWVVTTSGNPLTAVTGESTNSGSAASGSGGTLTWFQDNHLACPTVGGAFEYAFYGRTSGSLAYIGMSRPNENTYDDFGAAYNSPVTPPHGVSSTPPVAATADDLVATITAPPSGSTITVSANAGSTASGQTLWQADDAPLLNVAALALTSGSQGLLYIPAPTVAGAFYRTIGNVNFSALSDPTNNVLHFVVNGQVNLGTWEIAANTIVDGSAAANSLPSQFSKTSGTQMICSGNPCFYIPPTPVYSNPVFQNVHLVALANNMTLIDSWGVNGTTLTNFLCTDQGGGVNWMGECLHTHGEANSIVNNALFEVSVGTTWQTTNEGVVLDEWPVGNGNDGNLNMDNGFFASTGIGLGGSVTGSGSSLQINSYRQAGMVPFLETMNSNTVTNITVNKFVEDTSGSESFVNASGINKTLNLQSDGGCAIGNLNYVTGYPWQQLTINGTSCAMIGPPANDPGQNINLHVNFNGVSILGEFQRHSLGESEIFDLGAVTGVSSSPTSGGTLPVQTEYYIVLASGQDGGETGAREPGVIQASCTTTSGNQTCTTTWTALLNAASYSVYRCPNLGSCNLANGLGFFALVNACSNVTGTSCADNGGGTGAVPPSTSTTGSTSLNGAHVITPSVTTPVLNWPDVPAVTGQIPVVQNGSSLAPRSPGLPDSSNSPVSTTPYTIACDTTTLIDRAHLIRFVSGAAAVTVPLSTATGCGGGFVTKALDVSAGTLTFTASGGDTFTVLNGSTATVGATSFTLANGQFATLTQGTTGLWEITISTAGGSGVSGNNATVANDTVTGTVNNEIAQFNSGGTGAIVPSAAIVGSGGGVFIGVVLSGGGTSGNATIVIAGNVPCLTDNTAVLGDWAVQGGSGVFGKCHDSGVAFGSLAPTGSIGRFTDGGAAGLHGLDINPMARQTLFTVRAYALQVDTGGINDEGAFGYDTNNSGFNAPLLLPTVFGGLSTVAGNTKAKGVWSIASGSTSTVITFPTGSGQTYTSTPTCGVTATTTPAIFAVTGAPFVDQTNTTNLQLQVDVLTTPAATTTLSGTYWCVGNPN